MEITSKQLNRLKYEIIFLKKSLKEYKLLINSLSKIDDAVILNHIFEIDCRINEFYRICAILKIDIKVDI